MAKNEVKQDSGKKFYRVRFHERSADHEPKTITIGVNGHLLVIQRGVEVVLPEEYVNVARNSIVDFKIPNIVDGSKVMSSRKTFRRCPFDLLGEASEDEFLQMRDEGMRKYNEEMKKRIQEE